MKTTFLLILLLCGITFGDEVMIAMFSNIEYCPEKPSFGEIPETMILYQQPDSFCFWRTKDWGVINEAQWCAAYWIDNLNDPGKVKLTLAWYSGFRPGFPPITYWLFYAEEEIGTTVFPKNYRNCEYVGYYGENGSAIIWIEKLGDLNADGVCDLEDFSVLVTDWMKPYGEYKGDISGIDGVPDGVVDYYDLSELVDEWFLIN